MIHACQKHQGIPLRILLNNIHYPRRPGADTVTACVTVTASVIVTVSTIRFLTVSVTVTVWVRGLDTGQSFASSSTVDSFLVKVVSSMSNA